MNKFSYVATDVNGKTTRGNEMAEDFKDLQQKLRERNLYVTSYRDLGSGAVDVKYKFKTKEVSFISRQLGSMTSAGLSLVRALYILQDQQENKKAKAVLLDIYEEVQKGKSFSDVLKSKPGVFPEMFVSLVRRARLRVPSTRCSTDCPTTMQTRIKPRIKQRAR